MPSPDALKNALLGPRRYFGAAIRRQLVAAVVIVHAVLIIAFTLDLGLRQVHAMDAARADRARSLAQMLATTSKSWVLSNDISGLEEVVGAASSNKDLRYAMILSPSGHVLAHTDPSRRGLQVMDSIGRSLLAGPAQYKVLAKTSPSLDVAAPILADGTLVGWTWVSLSRADVRRAESLLFWQGTIYVAAAILVGGVIAAAMARSITGGLTQLVGVVGRFKDGDRSVRLMSRRRDELGVVADGIDAMLESIVQSEQQLLSARDAAEAANRAKDQFLANISHELRTPMNGVLVALHLLKAEPSVDERDRLIAEALTSGAGLSDLLGDLIDYADLESGLLELDLRPTDPVAELESVLAILRPKAKAVGLSLNAKTVAPIGWVEVDSARLRKVFFHLISNALKFTPAGSITVSISASGEGDAQRLRFKVKDTGLGISPAHQAHLFERFTPGDGSSTRAFGGAGLGLALTRRIAARMSGDIGFTSAEGQGSVFWVDVATPSCAAPKDHTPPGEGWLAGLRVLVVEDNPTNRLLAAKLLDQLGAEVAMAEDGAQGVAAVERSDFDLIFMDIQMPVMDGLEATRRIRAMPEPKRSVPIVATTANVMPDQVATYRRSGMNGVVAKPISPAALLSEVSRVANDSSEVAISAQGKS